MSAYICNPETFAAISTFAELGEVALGLVTDSNGLLALAVNRGSAARELAVAETDQVWLRPGKDDNGVTVQVRLG
mgnify:CR=1 FL=1